MSRQSFEWLKKKISDIRDPRSIATNISREPHRQTDRFKVGGLYFFFYDPKTKDQLPYYDVFPLVLILEKYNDGFLGLNLHYLPIKYRAAFLDKLMDYAVVNENNDITRMRVSYDILNATRRFREFKPCLKRYLHGHVRSKLITVGPNEWDVATFLPVQQFKKAKSIEVWEDSIQQIRES
jgi:hypothetical protein